jgi:quercetin dioxygenase-like cupin family protein
MNDTQRSAMEIRRNGSAPSARGPADCFTGRSASTRPFRPHRPGAPGGAIVTFEPGARTAWHTHPLGQTLLVTAGVGWTQVEGGPVEEIRSGDVVICPANRRHWHGATPTTAMTHVAIAEALDGKVVDWMEHVTDAQYHAPEANGDQ